MLKQIIAIVVFLVTLAVGIGIGIFAGKMMSMDMSAMMGGPGEMPPPAVKAVELQDVPVDVREEYIASVEPVQQVMVKTEVAGYIDEVHFTEGSMVKAGDLLFTVDQKRYLSMVDAREADLASAKAELNRAERYFERIEKAGSSVSQSDKDQAEALKLQAMANLKQAEANLTVSKLDLEYSEIRAPIDGRIGAALVTKGNYIDPMTGETLATIVQLDPIRVVFSVTDRAYLRYRENVVNGADSELAAHIRLPTGTELPMIGKKDFDDNTMNERTGTMTVRYLFDNPDELLVAGGYVTILIGRSDRPMGIRIPQQAVLVDQEGSYVLTATEDGVIGVARVTLGEPVEDDYVITSGLKAGDRVVVDGVQKVQPGMTAAVTLMEAAQ
ncbi:efflux RND transporter periplasmic adaptor subunit [Pontiella agarivorans]|uniref:Efflux RND transporter periplasmic adaptor subunit n=1 Tax=Pontiella agarivorans TaxID=3038953 RepID=A0ABU5MXW2_9BACT|nr:efflux RND transporter periplasmic adaptor subunit [Pontiella agarivorans]MDZ8118811.1 efflux RND transporter periplasmic adaptor subunit [Pontiella agarivorans]